MSNRSFCQEEGGNVVVTGSQADTSNPVLDFLVTALLEGGSSDISALQEPLQNCCFLPGLTFGDLDVQSSADQSHQGGGEVHCHVLSDRHIHQDQPLWGREKATAGGRRIKRSTGERGRQVQRSNAETKKKGKDPHLSRPYAPYFTLLLFCAPLPPKIMPNSKGKGTGHSVGLPQS